MKQLIVGLHGFLGRPTDFNVLKLPLTALDVFRLAPGPLWPFAARLNRGLPKDSVIVGYSLGGRLGFHMMIENPTQFKAGIFLASHPGLRSAQEKNARWALDQKWAQKFLHQPWSELMGEWNERGVLSLSKPLIRKEEDYDRKVLAQAQKYFSLGAQDYLVPQLNQLNIPLLFITPEEEKNNLSGINPRHPRSKILTIPSVTHRFMWSEPHKTRQQIVKFLQSLE